MNAAFRACAERLKLPRLVEAYSRLSLRARIAGTMIALVAIAGSC